MKELSLLQNPISINFIFFFLYFPFLLLTPIGLICFETGSFKEQNSSAIIIKNLMTFICCVLTFWFIGQHMMVKPQNTEGPYFLPLLQGQMAALCAMLCTSHFIHYPRPSLFLFLPLFLSSFLFPFGFQVLKISLDPFTSGGMLDFGGGSYVHAFAAWVTLAGIFVLKKDDSFRPRSIRSSMQSTHLVFAFLGTFFLLLGRLALNWGSTMQGNFSLTLITFNTLMSGCFGSLSGSLMSLFLDEKYKVAPEMINRGLLGGIVAISAACPYVETYEATLIGFMSGPLVFYGSFLLKKIFSIEDPLGTISIHGLCGTWGVISIPLFISQEKLGDISRLSLLGTQIIGLFILFLWAFGGSLIFFLIFQFFRRTRWMNS